MAEILEVSKEEIAVALDSDRQIESIQEDAYNSEKGEQKMSKLERISTGRDEASMIIDKICIKQLIERLDNREKEIILLRYYKEKTQAEVAKILGITQVQVSRIEKKILTSMKVKLTVS